MPRPRTSTALAMSEPNVEAVPLLAERARLAEAMTAVAAVQAEIAKTPSLIEEAEDAHHAALLALNETEHALARTQSMAAAADSYTPPPRPPASFWSQEAADTYFAEQNTPPIPIADARHAVEVATEAKQSTGARLRFLRSQASRLDEDLRRKRDAVKDARRRVLKASPELAALAVEVKRLATLLASATLAFQSATGNEFMGSDTPFHDIDKPSKWTDDPDSWALSRAWHAALDQLETDPAAALPMPESVP